MKQIILILLLSITCSAQLKSKTKVNVKATPFASVANPTVTLTCSAGATGTTNAFNIYRSATAMVANGAPGSGGGVTVNTSPLSTCNFVDNTVNFGDTYYYAATGLNTSLSCPSGDTCESNYSNIDQVNIPANPIPSPPTLNTPTVTASNQVQLNWEEASANTGFRVWELPPKRAAKQIATGVPCCNYQTNSLSPGNYGFFVEAVNKVGKNTYVSNPSNIQTTVIP